MRTRGALRCSTVFFFKQKTAYEMLRSLVGSEMCIRDSVKHDDALEVGSGPAHDLIKARVFDTGRTQRAIGLSLIHI